MVEYEETSITIEEMSGIVCDKCKTAIKIETVEDMAELDDWFRITNRVEGYFSKIGDECVVDLDLCPDCYKELLGPYLQVIPVFTG